jgi:hypothetical protein
MWSLLGKQLCQPMIAFSIPVSNRPNLRISTDNWPPFAASLSLYEKSFDTQGTCAQKIVPKYIFPFKIIKVIEPGSHLSLRLARGASSMRHPSLVSCYSLRIDDSKFPNRSTHQVQGFGIISHWPVDRTVSHCGAGKDAIFEVLWKSGDRSWE